MASSKFYNFNYYSNKVEPNDLLNVSIMLGCWKNLRENGSQ